MWLVVRCDALLRKPVPLTLIAPTAVVRPATHSFVILLAKQVALSFTFLSVSTR